MIEDIIPFVLNTKRPLSDIWLLSYEQNSFGCFWQNGKFWLFFENTQNCFAYISATKYRSEVILYSKRTAKNWNISLVQRSQYLCGGFLWTLHWLLFGNPLYLSTTYCHHHFPFCKDCWFVSFYYGPIFLFNCFWFLFNRCLEVIFVSVNRFKIGLTNLFSKPYWNQTSMPLPPKLFWKYDMLMKIKIKPHPNFGWTRPRWGTA